jgi:hypothetical protein
MNAMNATRSLVGTRVRVRARSHVLQLDAATGEIVRPDDQWESYVIVRLARPALYDNGVSPPTPLQEIRVALDNLEPLEPRPDWPATDLWYE